MFSPRQWQTARGLALMTSAIVVILALPACQTAGGGGGGGETDDPPMGRPENIEAGRLVYEDSCAGCHGTPGDHDGGAPDLLAISPARIETVLTGGGHSGGRHADLGTDDYANLGAHLEAGGQEGADLPGGPGGPAVPDRPPGAMEACVLAGCLDNESLNLLMEHATDLRAAGETQAAALTAVRDVLTRVGLGPADCPDCADAVVAEVYGGTTVAPDIPIAPGPGPAGHQCDPCLSAEDRETTVEWLRTLPAEGVSQADAVAIMNQAMIDYGLDPASCPGCVESMVAEGYAGADPGPGPGPETPGTGSGDPRLVGSWWYESNYWDETSGYSSTRFVTIELHADGTCRDSAQTCVTGSGCTEQGEAYGRWTANNDMVTVTYEDGAAAEFSYYIEDQADGRVMMTWPGGTGDPTLWTYGG